MKTKFWDYWWVLKTKASRIKCLFVDHRVVYPRAYEYQDDYCSRCYVDWPEEHTTIPVLLQRTYAWVVERDWDWFERLDLWLIKNHNKRLPHWWSY